MAQHYESFCGSGGCGDLVEARLLALRQLHVGHGPAVNTHQMVMMTQEPFGQLVSGDSAGIMCLVGDAGGIQQRHGAIQRGKGDRIADGVKQLSGCDRTAEIQ